MTATQAIALREELHALNQRLDQLMYVIHEHSASMQSNLAHTVFQRELLKPDYPKPEHPHKPTIELAA